MLLASSPCAHGSQACSLRRQTCPRAPWHLPNILSEASARAPDTCLQAAGMGAHWSLSSICSICLLVWGASMWGRLCNQHKPRCQCLRHRVSRNWMPHSHARTVVRDGPASSKASRTSPKAPSKAGRRGHWKPSALASQPRTATKPR